MTEVPVTSQTPEFFPQSRARMGNKDRNRDAVAIRS